MGNTVDVLDNAREATQDLADGASEAHGSGASEAFAQRRAAGQPREPV